MNHSIGTKLRASDNIHGLLMVRSDSSLKLVIKPKQNILKHQSLTILGKNLYTGEYDLGHLRFGRAKLYPSDSEAYRTTRWFPVLASQGKSLVLSGTGHNRSTWQFKTSKGSIITKAGLPQKYKEPSDVNQNKTFSIVAIPENAQFARVYYACINEDDNNSLDSRIQIEYGRVPTNYEPFQSRQILLPDMTYSDTIYYEKGEWFLNHDSKTKSLKLEPLAVQAGNSLFVEQDTFQLEAIWSNQKQDKITSGIYGIRWNIHDPNPVCERIGDGTSLHFNYKIDDTDATPYQNDFDRIYPWSDIRVCSVHIKKGGKRAIIYEGEEGFKRDGSVGNIMVEIPKFYCKREVIDDYEYLWISGTSRDGFTLDPSFITKQGVVEHIYIGTYLSRIKNKKLMSVSNSYPLIKKSPRKLREIIEDPRGFTECDLLSILTVQRLYLVETAVLDSQSLFTGNVLLPYLLKDKSTSYYGVKTESATNRIFVERTAMTERFRVGDAVSVIGSWKDYKNKPEVYQRVITHIKSRRHTLEISFTGEPVEIIKGDTGITCIPCRNGETDRIPYHTGSIDGKNGHASFKYRGIENLWGNVFILLDNAFVRNSQLYVTYPTGNTVRINYPLPVQTVELSLQQFNDPVSITVKKMGYDQENPLIPFPCEIGNGATTYSYYCDAWYNLGKEDVTYVLVYGGAWDNKGYAGIFNFRATFTEDQAIPCNGARMMLR